LTGKSSQSLADRFGLDKTDDGIGRWRTLGRRRMLLFFD